MSDAAYFEIRRRIILNELQAGQSIDEQSLARSLDVGRTPVREAVLRLAREGLLRVIPRKGIIVEALHLDTLRQCFEARSPCEVQAARLASFRAEPQDIEVMEQCLAGVEQLIEKRQFRELLQRDDRFHMAIADAARNPLLRDMLSTLYAVGIRFWYTTLAQRPLDDIKHEMRLHVDVLDAIKTHDPDKTTQAMRTVISGFPDRIAGMLRPDKASIA